MHLDVGVGRLKPQDLPPTYVQMGVKMFVERLRRGLCIHPEFSDQLSDFDKSLLWKKNFSLAGALSMVKVFLNKLFENRRDNKISLLIVLTKILPVALSALLLLLDCKLQKWFRTVYVSQRAITRRIKPSMVS